MGLFKCCFNNPKRKIEKLIEELMDEVVDKKITALLETRLKETIKERPVEVKEIIAENIQKKNLHPHCD